MYDTLAELEALLDNAEESVTLEFKSGFVFRDFNDHAKVELVKDATAFANAGGGTIIFGIAEKKRKGKTVADKIEAVPTRSMPNDRLSQILWANTDPSLTDFSIGTIDAPPDGQILVLRIEAGHTAFQNRLDKLFYQRVEATSPAMYGYAIRDVMNRRTSPIVRARIDLLRSNAGSNVQICELTPVLTNEGAVTAHHWTLAIDLPAGQLVKHTIPQTIFPRGNVEAAHHSFQRFEYSSEHCPPVTTLRLLPGEQRSLGENAGFGRLEMKITPEVYRALSRNCPPIRWTLFVDNARMRVDSLAFEKWCIY